ncbi:MAG TPA: sodium ion-translocating decarboxylase subunit beta [Dehalococcoidia bacterium]|jgi:oxaloacetate decarboxylase beta subunit|nr:sodium ion-translocating decarboxylase subunit beta [Dehalococcoidia bacterium]
MSFPFWEFFQGIYTLFQTEAAIAGARIFLIVLGFFLIYLAYKRVLEPLVMIPMGFGMIAVNAGVLMIEATRTGTLFVEPLAPPEKLMYFLQVDFLQPIYTFTFSNGLIACLIFMGVGAITDLDYLLAKPVMSLLLAVCAELGTIATLPIAIACGLLPEEAAAIAIVGGADGPMVLYGSIILAEHLFVPIAVVAYIYLSIIYAGYPYLIKLMIPKRLRGIEMDPFAMPKVSATEKFAFSVAACGILCLLFPVAAPLFVSFFVGVAIKEANILRFVEFLSQPLLYGATFFLGLTLGALLSAEVILNTKVLILMLLGMVALLLSGIGGLAGGLICYRLSNGKFNPLVGIAAVSCIPTTAKVAQKCAAEANSRAMILPYAMGPCVAGVITSAIITGIYVSAIGFVKW